MIFNFHLFIFCNELVNLQILPGLNKEIIATQLSKGLEGLSAAEVGNNQLVIAYEPVSVYANYNVFDISVSLLSSAMVVRYVVLGVALSLFCGNLFDLSRS